MIEDILIFVACVMGCGGVVFLCALADCHTPKKYRPPKPPKVDYHRINRIEVDLGMRQSDFREHGVEPIDTTRKVLTENAMTIAFVDRAMNIGSREVEEREWIEAIQQSIAVGVDYPHQRRMVWPMDMPHPVEILPHPHSIDAPYPPLPSLHDNQ